MKNLSIYYVMVICFLSACQSPTLMGTSTPTSTVTPSATSTITPSPTYTPTITPTPMGGGSGTIVYTEGSTLYSIDTNGKNKKIIEENCPVYTTFSPDGRFMTCSKYKKIDENNYGFFGIIVIDLNTHKVVKRLVESALIIQAYGDKGTLVNDSDYPYFDWSPNSKQFAFIGTFEGKTGLYNASLENSSAVLLYESQNLLQPKWSPEGNKILFFEVTDTTGYRIDGLNVYVVNLDGTHLVKLTEKPGSYSTLLTVWGKDENTVFPWTGRLKMEGIDLDTMQPNGETLPSPIIDRDYIPSPDHQFNLSIKNLYEKVFLESNDGSEEIDISKFFNLDRHFLPDFQWSPDSKTLAYYDPIEKAIVLMSVETLTVSQLVKVAVDENGEWSDSYVYGEFLWLPDSKQIAFVQGDGSGGFVASLVDLSGNVKTLFTAKYPINFAGSEPRTVLR